MIPARPTIYNGVAMRSRLEARYAAMLDEDGFNWTYEPRAYASPKGQYLPDFQISHPDDPEDDPPRFVEVRPNVAGLNKAIEQMPIIWASEPTATLMVVIPDVIAVWAAGLDPKPVWRRTVPR